MSGEGPRFARSAAELPTLAEMAALSGLDFMRSVLEGRLPAPPIAEPMGIVLVEVGEGRVVFEGRPVFSHLNPMGGVHGGWYGTLLDSALGCAVMTRLPAGRGYTTLEYKVNILRGARPGEGPYRTEGIASHVGRRTGVGEARMTDPEGRLIATGSTTCLVMEIAG